jgi:hypothetical protein
VSGLGQCLELDGGHAPEGVLRPGVGGGGVAIGHAPLGPPSCDRGSVPFTVSDPTLLSGRGYLWMLARDELFDPATLLHGTGMLGWQHVREAGLIDFAAVYSVHNQWLDVLYSTGLIGFLLFVAALAVLIRQAGRTYGLVVGCVLLPVFILSITERPWPIDTADWLFWAVPGALLSYPVARRLSGDQIMETPRASEESVAHSAAHRGAQGDHQTETASR